MSIDIVTGFGRRTCRICNKSIEKGDLHLRFDGGYKGQADNICKSCLWKLAFKLVMGIDMDLSDSEKKESVDEK